MWYACVRFWPERRTPPCPVKRTSLLSTSGRNKSWRWRWKKVSVCIIKETCTNKWSSNRVEQTNHAFTNHFKYILVCVFLVSVASLFAFPAVLYLSLSPLASLFSLSPDKPCAVVSRACPYACCVISRYSFLSGDALLLLFFFFSLSVFNRSKLTLHLCPGQSLHTSTSGSTLQVKKVQKNFKNNYASVECGAKILSANSEAKVRNTSPLSPPAYTQPHTQLTMSCFFTTNVHCCSKQEGTNVAAENRYGLINHYRHIARSDDAHYLGLAMLFQKKSYWVGCPISHQRWFEAAIYIYFF